MKHPKKNCLRLSIVLMLISFVSCVEKKEESTPRHELINNAVAQRGRTYKHDNDSNFFKYKRTEYSIVDSVKATKLRQLNLNYSEQWQNDLDSYKPEHRAIVKNFIRVADSMAEFYKAFRGYKIWMTFYIKNDTNCLKETIWTDTTGNIVLHSYPWKLNRLTLADKENSFFRYQDLQKYPIPTKWWSDTLPPDFNVNVFDKTMREYQNELFH